MSVDRIIGSYNEETGEIERGVTSQGCVYKNFDTFLNGKGVCYIPELSDNKYTRKNFVEIALYNCTLATFIYNEVDWQSPEALFDEMDDEDEYYWLLYSDSESYSWKLQTLAGNTIASIVYDYDNKEWLIHITVADVDIWFNSEYKKLSEIQSEAENYLSKYVEIDSTCIFY